MSDNEQLSQNQNGNLVVRIDQDQDMSLETLFESVLKPGGTKPLSVPYKMRKLPKSFFQPPSTGSKSPSVSSISHSRENSGDSAFGTIMTSTGTGLQINHSRAHSSPASLQQTYASAQAQQQTQHQHPRQRSYDIGAVDELGPLPPGWGQATTPEGQVYFLNHNDRSTTWEDPRKSNVASSQQQQCRNAITAALASASPADLHSHTQQGGGCNAVSELVSSSAGSGTGSGAGSGTDCSGPLSPVGSESALGPLPEGWEQAKTQTGEMYFINHLTCTTSWLDPRIPSHLQRVPPSGLAPHLQLNSWIAQPVSPTQVAQINETNRRLQSLQAERHVLKIRQQQILLTEKEIMQRNSQQELLQRNAQPELMQRNAQPELSAMQRTGRADPFLTLTAAGDETAPNDHSRQESADSGLGMGNNNYPLPHTPDDFLVSIDDSMDGVSDGTADMSVLDSQEISDNIDATDDLVPTLQLDAFGSDILLNDVHTLINPSRGGNELAWL